MILSMLIIFIVGYVLIALEHKIKFDKAAIALLMCGGTWTILSVYRGYANISNELLEHFGQTAEILIFLIGAITIVNIIDSYDGFSIITQHITTRNKRKLLWLLSIFTFFMSAVLDNMTTAIIMVVLLNSLIRNKQERWIFAGIIIIAANSGGAWSPIGDITTIMLWMKGNITTMPLMGNLFLPSLVSMIISTLIATRYVKNEDIVYQDSEKKKLSAPTTYSKNVLIFGVLSLLFVPIFKSITDLPPFMGMMVSLGAMWVITEGIYDKRKKIENPIGNRIYMVLKNVDLTTILFFLGILMSVSALQTAGILDEAANFLDKNIRDTFLITSIIGVLSSIIDNVPLVAAAMGMYPLLDSATVLASADPAYAQVFVKDGMFWHLLAYCAGTGGSLLIIGSAAGVVTMGLQKIDFVWYVKKISLLAFAGYLAGIAVLYLQYLIVRL